MCKPEWKPEWEIGAPVEHHCCSADCDGDWSDPPLACWTLLNPADGGDPMFYCEDCHRRMEKEGK